MRSDEEPRRDRAVTVYVALGSNLGDRGANLRGALDALAAHPSVTVTRCSTIIETKPVGGPDGQDVYLNAVAQLETLLSPRQLHELLIKIETDFGRQRTVHNGPRTLDLDLLLYGDRIIDTKTLTVPHPRMHERRFVMAPLAEIAPDVRHPVLNQTAAEILSEI